MNDQKQKILVVDDNQTNRIILLAVLEKFGFHAEEATSGFHALEILQTQTFDLILMDVMMPEMDGCETTRRIRNGHSGILNSTVPILAMTADLSCDTRKNCQEVGMNGFLSKPIEPLELKKQIDGNLLLVSEKNSIEMKTSSLHRCQDSAGLEDLSTLKWSELLRYTGGDIGMAKEILSIVLEDMPPLIDLLERSILEGNFIQTKRFAHTIKGESSNIGAFRLRHLAERMELLLVEKNLSQVQKQSQSIRSEFQKVAQVIDTLLHPDYNETQNPIALEQEGNK